MVSVYKFIADLFLALAILINCLTLVKQRKRIDALEDRIEVLEKNKKSDQE